MVRVVLDGLKATTIFALLASICMRGGQAFAACCARCRGNSPATFAQQQARDSSSLSVRTARLRKNPCNSAARPLSGVGPEAQRRTKHSELVVMSQSTNAASAVAAAAAEAACPTKRHRNTFLLPLRQPQHQHQQRRLPGSEATQPTAGEAHSRGGGQLIVDGNKGAHHAEAAAAAATEGVDGNDDDDVPLALVILNAQGDSESKHLLRHLWGRANLRICADGGANRLHDSFGGGGSSVGRDQSEERAKFVPDIIVGDLDSLRPDVALFYEGLGCEIKLSDDQNLCDFEKCLLEVEGRLSPSSPPDGGAATVDGTVTGTSAAADALCGLTKPYTAATVVGLGAFGGRFDHEMQAVSLLHAYTPRFHRFVLLGAGNVAFLLEPGLDHAVEPLPRFEGPTVGLIPVGGPCRAVTTEGLRWNLEGRGLEFGVCVSSSNRVVEDVVRVTADAPLVWTAEFKTAAWVEEVLPASAV